MIQPRRYFPWRIARHHFFNHFFFVLITLVVTGFSLRYFVFTQFANTTDIPKALGQFDNYLTTLFIAVLLVGAVFLVITTRFYFRPLGRLIQRARMLRRGEVPTVSLSD